jgi:DNA-binding NarL/FixJ family response regulator
MKNRNNIKIVIAENSLILRSGISAVLKRLSDYTFSINEVSNMDAFMLFSRLHRPEIAIINPLFLGGVSIANYKRDNPDTKVVALVSGYFDNKTLADFDGSISIFDDLDTVNDTISSVLHIEEDDDNIETEQLSQREKEIIGCVVKGLTNKAIAEKLSISIHTVITHRRNISKKLQIHSSAGLAIYAIVNKIVEIQDIKSGIS